MSTSTWSFSLSGRHALDSPIDTSSHSHTRTTFNSGKQGALLRLPHDGIHQDIIRTKVFEDCIRDHIDSWFFFAQRRGLVERMEDLILVSGCTLVTSWAVTTFDDNTGAEVSSKFQTPSGSRARFGSREVRPSLTYQNGHQASSNLRQNQCVFIRGFRAKRVFSWTRPTGATGPTRVPGVYRDPLTEILDYVAEVGVPVFFRWLRPYLALSIRIARTIP